MPIQFYCPSGHLLEGHESAMGQQAQCPHCGATFIVPLVAAAVPVEPQGFLQKFSMPPLPATPTQGANSPAIAAPPPIGSSYVAAQSTSPPASPVDAMRANDAVAPGGDDEMAAAIARFGQIESAKVTPTDSPPTQPQNQPRVYHIPCPQGHELETDEEMLGQYAMCPICQSQFELRRKDSIEVRQEEAEREARRQTAMNRFWLKWSIAAAVTVVLFLGGIVAYVALN